MTLRDRYVELLRLRMTVAKLELLRVEALEKRSRQRKSEHKKSHGEIAGSQTVTAPNAIK